MPAVAVGQVREKLASGAADGEKAAGAVVDLLHSFASVPEIQPDLSCSFVEPVPVPELELELDAGPEPALAPAHGVVLERSGPSDFWPLLIAAVCLEVLSSRFPVGVSEMLGGEHRNQRDTRGS